MGNKGSKQGLVLDGRGRGSSMPPPPAAAVAQAGEQKSGGSRRRAGRGQAFGSPTTSPGTSAGSRASRSSKNSKNSKSSKNSKNSKKSSLGRRGAERTRLLEAIENQSRGGAKALKSTSHGSDAVKVVLVGVTDAGKSTLFKQLSLLFGDSHHVERLTQGAMAHDLFFVAVATMVLRALRLYLRAVSELGLSVSDDIESATARIATYDVHERKDLTEAMVADACKIWADPAVREAAGKARSIPHGAEEESRSFLDSATYFLDRLDTIAGPEYVLNEHDVLMAGRRTIGLDETTIEFHNEVLAISDCGGAAPERRKWKGIFRRGYEAVVLVVPCSDYDILIPNTKGESVKSALAESFSVFSSLCANEVLASSKFYIVLNKVDLIREQWDAASFKAAHRNFDGTTPEEALDFIEQTFQTIIKTFNRTALFYRTSAVNSDTVYSPLMEMLHAVTRQVGKHQSDRD